MDANFPFHDSASIGNMHQQHPGNLLVHVNMNPSGKGGQGNVRQQKKGARMDALSGIGL
tara:strand:- start:191 stop:367 length:177 start_codon:yes stop_codon:yes gene_type:complete